MNTNAKLYKVYLKIINQAAENEKHPDSSFAIVRARQWCLSHCESNRGPVVFHAGYCTTRPQESDES